MSVADDRDAPFELGQFPDLMSVTDDRDAPFELGYKLEDPVIGCGCTLIKTLMIRKLMGHAKLEDNEVFLGKLPRDDVFYFVEELERVHQYYETLKHLRAKCHHIRHDTNPEDVVAQIVHDQEPNNKSYKVVKEAILCALKDHIEYLQLRKNVAEHSPRNKYLNKDKPMKAFDPLSDLVLRLQEQDHVMDLNPEVELVKIETSNPRFYFMYFDAQNELKKPVGFSDFKFKVEEDPPWNGGDGDEMSHMLGVRFANTGTTHREIMCLGSRR